MLKDAMDFFLKKAKSPETREINGQTFSLEQWHQIPATFDQPTIKPFTVNTLTGLKDYIIKNIDKVKEEHVFIHVESHDTVRLMSELFGENHQRNHYVTATTKNSLNNGFRFDTFISIPEFIIALQAYFVSSPEVISILKFVSNIKADQGQTYSDNGVSQTVTARRSAGSSLVDLVDVPNPVSLKPFRTFMEVEQPESSFVFRLAAGNEDSPPKVALFEASGGAWKLDAIQKIAAWFEKEGIEIPVIA